MATSDAFLAAERDFSLRYDKAAAMVEVHVNALILTMTVAEEFAKANQGYADSFGEKGSLALPPSRKVTVVTSVHPSPPNDDGL